MSLTLLTGPAVEPLDLPTAKLWARIDGDEFDPVLPMMITAARQVAEQELGSKLINQVWRATLTDWPQPTDRFDLFPVSAISASYYDGSFWQSLLPMQASYYMDRFAVNVETMVGGVYPALGSITGERIRLDFTVGYGADGTFVPAAIRQFMAAHLAYWIRSPEAATERYPMVRSPFLMGLLDPFRTWL